MNQTRTGLVNIKRKNLFVALKLQDHCNKGEEKNIKQFFKRKKFIKKYFLKYKRNS